MLHATRNVFRPSAFEGLAYVRAFGDAFRAFTALADALGHADVLGRVAAADATAADATAAADAADDDAAAADTAAAARARAAAEGQFWRDDGSAFPIYFPKSSKKPLGQRRSDFPQD